MKDIVNSINLASTRTEVKEIIEANCKTKKQLLELAKELDIFIINNAKKERMVDRIIELTIGFKI